MPDRMISESELENAVYSILQKIMAQTFGLNADENHDDEDQFFPTKEAAKRLGISSKTLIDRRDWPEYKYGIHWQNSSGQGGNGARYEFNVKRCREVKKIPPEKLKPRD